ncbi:unnamed protein product [Vicia faba]|uniref:Aminotransferase-like plant mobile domain-containing protein n=1 Tax=Vicia faba TaxID=3906 RepID=A0AAV0YNC8_VICFA|nr:unnamed protein product [Vicia faba]
MPIISPVAPLQSPYPYARRWLIKKLDYQNNPRHHLQGYRFRIDHMLEDQFIWRPYLGLAPQRHEDSLIWSSTTYMICFHIVEMHQADRVKLQFGHLQGIPEEARCLAEHHKMTTLKARRHAYTTLYSDEQNCWLHRELFTLDGDQLQTEEKPSKEYMQWYHSLPHRYASYEQFLTDPRQNQYASTQASGSQQTHHSQHSQPPQPQSFQQQTPHFSQHQTPIPHYPEQQTFNPHLSQLQTPAPYFYQNQTFNTQYPQSHSQPNYIYESQQPQFYNRPTTQFTPIMRPNFDSSSSQHNPPYFPTMCPPQQPQYNLGEDLNVSDYDLLQSIWSPPQATAPTQDNPPTSDATQQNPPTTETEEQYGFGHRAPRPRHCFTDTRLGPDHQH